MNNYDMIVVGGGHAGIEAAVVSSGMGLRTLLVTMDLKTIGWMPCNPAIGGVSKGNLVVELDALGGVMPLAADVCGIQFRILNRSKGMAVWGLRAQEDRFAYAHWIQNWLTSREKLDLLQAEVASVETRSGRITGVTLIDGSFLTCRAMVLTSGTFLRGIIHMGQDSHPAGRAGAPPSNQLSDSLKRLGLKMGRLKTGTSPRVLKNSIDISRMERQDGDEDAPPFSMRSPDRPLSRVPCYITYTNEEVHDLIRDNIHLSPMYSGRIQGIGPRYCPSIEDKVMKFAHHSRHQVFIEPEGLSSDLVYLNGVSTNMPSDIQVAMLHRIPGLQKAVIQQPGYAIEYDFVVPTQLNHTLRVREIEGLYLAGQINGTSGYEEAAVQGYWAGANAGLFIQERGTFCPGRREAYMGVLVDDLVLKGVDEPYRMMTARAEYRLRLGFHTAYRRLSAYGHDLGMIPDDLYETIQLREEKIRMMAEELDSAKVTPTHDTCANLNQKLGIQLNQETTISSLYRRVRGNLGDLLECLSFSDEMDPEFLERVSGDILYRPYLEKQEQLFQETMKWEALPIPKQIDFDQIPGLSREMAERLKSVGPETLGEAGRIPGLTPSALTTLYVYLRSG